MHDKVNDAPQGSRPSSTETSNSGGGFGRGSGAGDFSSKGGSHSGSNSGTVGSSTGKGKKDLGTVHRDLFTRPQGLDKRGKMGRAVACNANFVEIISDIDRPIHQLHVGFEPEIDAKQMRIDLVREQCVDIVGEHCIFDGMILYIPHSLPPENSKRVVKHKITGGDVTVTFRPSVTFGRNDPQAINIYNLLIREAFKAIGFVQVQRNFFDPGRANLVKEWDVEVWPGYETAVRMYEEQMMLCIENRFKVLRRATVFQQLVSEFKRASGNMELVKTNCDHTYTGSTILTLYNNRMHRLSRFEWDMNPMSQFHHAATDTKMSFVDYFKTQYGVTIQNMDQPLIVSEGKPKQPGEDPQVTYLVPELCNCTGLADSMRKDFKTMRVLSDFTRLSPDRRRDSTLKFIANAKANDHVAKMFNFWKVDFGNSLVDLPCRQLEPETLFGKGPTFSYKGHNAEWAKDVKQAGNFRTVNLNDWIIVCPDMPKAFDEAFKFIKECNTLGRTMQMDVSDPFKWKVDNPQATAYHEATKTAVENFQKETGKKAKMVVVIVNDDNKTRYDTVKKLLCHDMPVPSQIVKLETLAGKAGINKNYSSIVLKILLQINCKLGGAIWKVAIPLEKTMIVGYDLYHDSTMKGKTVGACCSSFDKDFTKWYSQTLPHSNPVELGDNLRKFTRKALQKYHEDNNGELPGRIFVYRDGCGDGQIPYVRDTEVRQVQEAAAEVGKALNIEYTPKLAFTIITKKVNMRVFKKVGATDLKNPDPGTVVDSVVTRPERYDFYMVPQFVNQGTVTPVCYNIIHDTTGMPPDRHHQLAFKLCHLYYNWQGTVRVPAPCQYAHKLAFLVAQSLHEDSNDALKDKLF
ncbi:hypothetical protein PENTCL1PPCAC_22903, partial [Pristionchus entomophagus]